MMSRYLPSTCRGKEMGTFRQSGFSHRHPISCRLVVQGTRNFGVFSSMEGFSPSLWWKKDVSSLNQQVDALISPLSPSQAFFLRIQARDALEAAFDLQDKMRSDQLCDAQRSIEKLNWKSISNTVNRICMESKPQAAEVYKNVWTRIWISDESTVFIHDEKLVYELIPRMVPHSWFCFYNLGFEELGTHAKNPVVLRPGQEEGWKYAVQLYHHVASKVELKGKDVVEIGCGRGGGAAFVNSFFHPKSYRAADVSNGNVKFCRKTHLQEGLTFERADAINLENFKDESCDVVLNVESSHCYTSMQKFISEVTRILKPGGHLCFTDSRHEAEIQLMQNDLKSSGLVLKEETDISENVEIGLQKFQASIPEMLDRFGATGDSRVGAKKLMEDLCVRWIPLIHSRKFIYLSATLQKPLKQCP